MNAGNGRGRDAVSMAGVAFVVFRAVVVANKLKLVDGIDDIHNIRGDCPLTVHRGHDSHRIISDNITRRTYAQVVAE